MNTFRVLVVLSLLVASCTTGGTTNVEQPVDSIRDTLPTETSVPSSLASSDSTLPPAPTTSSVTTQPPDSDVAGTAGVEGFVAHIGCSQTKLGIRGYEDLGGTRLERYETAGGQINLWSRDAGGYWSAFDEAVAGKKISAGWMEICITGGNERNTTYEDVVAALTVFQSKIPDNAPIYVSGLEVFEPIGSCRIAGPTIPAITRDYADRLVEAGLALRGPDLGPLTPESTTDGCHPNRIGQELVGQQLLAFFGS